MLKAEAEGHPNSQWWYRRLRSLGVLDIKDASCCQDSNGKVEWRCLGHQRNCSAVRPQKVQSASRYPRTVTLRYSVVPLWKRKKVSAQSPRDIYIPGLDQVLGQPGAAHAQLHETAYTFFLPLYGQKGCTTMNNARAHSYRCHKKPPPLKKLPPTDANLQ